MSVLQTKELSKLKDFSNCQHQLVIVERQTPDKADAFFQKLLQYPFSVVGQVSKKNSIDDIKDILKDEISPELQVDPFYQKWVEDMAEVSKIFSEALRSDAIGFCLGTQRGCRRYHIDNVPMRLLVTYSGKGTEWLPDEAADRRALARGASNLEIIKDPYASQFMNSWDISIFRGGSKGLLHRTPDAALNKPSILMRLDHVSFWDQILKNKQAVE